MALRSVSRLAGLAQLVPEQAAPSAWYVCKRFMALEGLKGYSDRESAMENIWVKREEERVLRKLLSRAKKDSDKKLSDDEKAKARKEELEGISNLIKKYKIDDADLDALIEWKHHDH